MRDGYADGLAVTSLAVTLLAVGCTPPVVEHDIDEPSRPSDTRAPPVSPDSTDHDSTDHERAEAAPLDCGACHVAIARDHGRSLHGRSAVDPLYRREVARVPDPSFCRPCHGDDGERAGLDCASCHPAESTRLASPITGHAPHAFDAAPALASDATCAPCHQFDFPHRPGQRMQATIDEAASLGEARSTCVSCHFEDHDVGVTDTMLHDAVRVSASARVDGDTVRVTLRLSAGVVGHAVPTGDVYRRLEVTAWIAGTSSRRHVEVARVFRAEPDGLHELRDERVPAGGSRTVTLVLPRSGSSDAPEVRWSIEWLALPRRDAEREGLDEAWWVRPMREGSTIATSDSVDAH